MNQQRLIAKTNWQRLYSACVSGNLKEIQQLHASGADMDVTRPCNNGYTPMYIACAKVQVQ